MHIHTQWLPLPAFLTYRLLLFLYTLLSLSLNIHDRSNTTGPHWLIFLTNLSYLLLSLTTTLTALACLLYSILYHTQVVTALTLQLGISSESHPRLSDLFQLLADYLPKSKPTVGRSYRLDHTPHLLKVVWCLYVVASSLALVVTAAYWGCVISLQVGGEGGGGVVNGSDPSTQGPTDTAPPTNYSSLLFCSNPREINTLQFHGANVLVVFLDLSLSRMPYQLLHMLYPSAFCLLYITFTLVYWGVGGVNHRGDPYIYLVLDYADRAAAGYALLLVVTGGMAHMLLWLLARLRDAVCLRYSDWCYRDLVGSAQSDTSNNNDNA